MCVVREGLFGAVCVRAEGQERGLCVCGKKARRGFEGALEKLRSGGAVRWSTERVFKNEKRNARTAVWEMWQLAVTTRACAENEAS